MNMFERFLYEAPGDDPPDTSPPTESPPDVPDNPPEIDQGDNLEDPPEIDLGDDNDGGGFGDSPPDMDDSFGTDDGSMNNETNDTGDENQNKDIGLDEKISAIMNMNLYQKFLSLLNTIAGQQTMLKNNSDILYSLSPESLDTIDSLKKLDENIRLYLKNYFLNENYSKNLLFFNKCLNLLKLLNDVLDKNVRKGINAMK